MASRWVFAAQVVALLSLSLLAGASHDLESLDAAESDANPVLRLPSERSNPSEQVQNTVPKDLPAAEIDHQDADRQDLSSTDTIDTSSLETSEPATVAIPNLETSLIPVRGHRFHRVHLDGPLLRGPEGTTRFFWFLRPRRHSRLFHQIFLRGRDGAAPMEVRFGGEDDQVAMKVLRGFQLPLQPLMVPQQQEEVEAQQRQQPRVLTFRIRRLGPHHRGMMMHNCAWRKRLEALAAAAEEQQKPQEQGGFTGLIKRFSVFLNPQQN